MNEQKPPANPRDTSTRDDDDDGAMSNVVLLLLFAGVVGAGIWLVSSLLDARKADDCITQGRRDCAPVVVRPQ
jgi:hypothetical protein